MDIVYVILLFLVGIYILIQIQGIIIASAGTNIYNERSARWWMNEAKKDKWKYLAAGQTFVWWYKGYRYLKKRGLNG